MDHRHTTRCVRVRYGNIYVVEEVLVRRYRFPVIRHPKFGFLHLLDSENTVQHADASDLD